MSDWFRLEKSGTYRHYSREVQWLGSGALKLLFLDKVFSSLLSLGLWILIREGRVDEARFVFHSTGMGRDGSILAQLQTRGRPIPGLIQ